MGRAAPVPRARTGTPCIPPARMLPALEATLAELGIDLARAGERAPRPRVAPGEEPPRLLRADRGAGARDARHTADRRPRRLGGALPRGGAHRALRAHVGLDLPMEARRLGDMAVTEGWAMLLQHLVTDPSWLNRRLDVPRIDRLEADGATTLLYFVRRYCAKLLYEIEFFQSDDAESMRQRYAELLTDAPQAPRKRGELPRPTSTAGSTSPATCARGPSRRSSATFSAASSATSGSPAARPAACSASSGRSARGRLPTSCCVT